MSRLPRLVLASGSPRRRRLLEGLGLDFAVRPVEVDETLRDGESAHAGAGRLALEKAGAEARPGELILGADTLVTIGGEVLGKPRDAAEAAVMLRRLAGREHEVVTGVALHLPAAGRLESEIAVSRVLIAPMSSEEIDWYVASGEPLDKAGAYAIQGLGALYVEAVDGNYSNVVGLPLPAVYRLFRSLGLDLRAFRRTASPST